MARSKDKDIPPVREEDFVKLFGSRSFASRLKNAGGITRNTSYEAGFAVGRPTYRNRIIYGEVVSFYEDTSDELILQRLKQNNEIRYLVERSLGQALGSKELSINEKTAFPLVDIHFHSLGSRAAFSEGDLYCFFKERERFRETNDSSGKSKLDILPVTGVATINNCGREMHIVLVQESGNSPRGRDFAEAVFMNLADDQDYLDDDPELIVGAIERQGNFKAAFLRYDLSDSSYRIRDGDIRKVRRFAYRPRLVE